MTVWLVERVDDEYPASTDGVWSVHQAEDTARAMAAGLKEKHHFSVFTVSPYEVEP